MIHQPLVTSSFSQILKIENQTNKVEIKISGSCQTDNISIWDADLMNILGLHQNCFSFNGKKNEFLVVVCL